LYPLIIYYINKIVFIVIFVPEIIKYILLEKIIEYTFDIRKTFKTEFNTVNLLLIFCFKRKLNDFINTHTILTILKKWTLILTQSYQTECYKMRFAPTYILWNIFMSS